jgi:hypothetical protein
LAATAGDRVFVLIGAAHRYILHKFLHGAGRVEVHEARDYLDPTEKVELTGSRAGSRIVVFPGFPICSGPASYGRAARWRLCARMVSPTPVATRS